MAPPFKDLVKIVNGLSLVAQEAAKRSEALSAAKSGDLETLISKTLKSLVVVTTDFAGLTRGKPREVSNPRPKESVVYFSQSEPEPVPAYVPKSDTAVSSVTLGEGDGSGKGVLVEEIGHVKVIGSELGDSGSTIAKNEEKNVKFAVNSSEEKDVKLVANSGEEKEQVLVQVPLNVKKRQPRERRVPSTPFTRALGFAGLGAGLAWGTLQESAKRIVYGTPSSDEKQSALSPYISEQNAERLALYLCRMRGAALKLGQMLSIQDESLVPAPILAALDIVRQGADVMPRSQLNDVLVAELGPDWSSKLRSFDYQPLASASIGQVHRAVMKDGREVAVKIQYPGVADSIESDIENVKRILDYTNLIPEGLFLDRAIKVAKEELSRECDYLLEAANQKRFRELVTNSEGFYVPIVIDEISSKKVLTTELVAGIPIDKVALLNQETRDYVGKKLLELTLKELFVFRFMQAGVITSFGQLFDC